MHTGKNIDNTSKLCVTWHISNKLFIIREATSDMSIVIFFQRLFCLYIDWHIRVNSYSKFVFLQKCTYATYFLDGIAIIFTSIFSCTLSLILSPSSAPGQQHGKKHPSPILEETSNSRVPGQKIPEHTANKSNYIARCHRTKYFWTLEDKLCLIIFLNII